MSGTPSKRLHEEAAAGNNGGSAHASGSSAGYPVSKLGQGSEFHHAHPPPDHMGQHQQQQDVRMPPKIPRNDPSRSPLPPAYHHHRNVSSSAPHSEVNPEVVAASETTRAEFKDNPPRDSKADGRELYQSGKGDERERDSYKDFDYSKAEKEGFGAGNSHLNWKESSKEHHRGKRYPDAQGGGGNLDPWHVSRGNMHAPGEKEVVSKEGSTVEERDSGVDARETVGENRVDLKGEDRFRDKDRKRKDLKHRDWGEKDKDRIERRNSDGKEPSKEERETDRWERERKDLSKDKERLKEREKDHTKREAWIVAEKDVPHTEKEPGDVPGSTSEPDHLLTEQKKQKDHDGWKNGDREVKDRRKERDGDTEGERPEKRSRGYEKESDDGYADADGGGDKERESFNYGVQQRKRMLRPRGSPQVGNREPRIKSRTQDNEGSQGKSEASTVVYRVGECMQELTNLWKEYKSSQADKGAESSQNGPTLEIRIPAEHVTATNRQVRGGQLWGTDVYTDDSDLVAVLMHTGYCRPTASPPPSAIQELRATVRVLPPQDCYISTLRNNVRSRSWGAAIGCSYRVERCCIVKKGGGTVDLEPCLTHTSTVEPTLAPVAVERTMTTRAAASNALRQQRYVREVTIQYNLCSEPWIKYSLSIVADKGLKKPLYTSARLKKGEVLYVETRSRRYELCFAGEKMVKATAPFPTHDKEIEKSQTHNLHTANGERVGALDGESVSTDVFRWSCCKKPLPQDEMRSIGIPLPLEHLEVLAENVDWEDIQWSQTGVFIAGKEYPLARMHFISPN